jgi:3-oxoacyl-[acyl-carrier protein] reductase
MKLTYNVSLTGHVALVTGAARNLPAVIAAEFAAARASVAINDVAYQDQAEALAASIKEKGGRAAVFMADVADREPLVRMVDEVQDESSKGLGTVDILINGAGPFAMDPFHGLPEADWDRVMDANLKAIYMLALFSCRRDQRALRR